MHIQSLIQKEKITSALPKQLPCYLGHQGWVYKINAIQRLQSLYRLTTVHTKITNVMVCWC